MHKIPDDPCAMGSNSLTMQQTAHLESERLPDGKLLSPTTNGPRASQAEEKPVEFGTVFRGSRLQARPLAAKAIAEARHRFPALGGMSLSNMKPPKHIQIQLNARLADLPICRKSTLQLHAKWGGSCVCHPV